MDVSFDPHTQPILDAAFRVHTALGPGLLESAYEACLEHLLVRAGHHVERQVPVSVEFEGLHLDRAYRIDLLVNRRVVVEVKAVDALLPVHHAQLLTYLRFARVSVGLLLNFQVTHLREGIHRKVLTFPMNS